MANGSRFRALVLLAAVLLAGLALGWFANERSRHARRTDRRDPERLVERMTEDLNLNSVQQDSIRAIFARRRADIDSLWADVHPRFEAIRTLTNAEIESLLTPDQRERFREEERRRDERRRGREGPRGPL
jgi:Spy/CpxP family protein refolding chaperone